MAQYTDIDEYWMFSYVECCRLSPPPPRFSLEPAQCILLTVIVPIGHHNCLLLFSFYRKAQIAGELWLWSEDPAVLSELYVGEPPGAPADPRRLHQPHPERVHGRDLQPGGGVGADPPAWRVASLHGDSGP